MNLKQVRGNTWVIEANGLIPVYLLDNGRCILLDSGLGQEREELEQTILGAGLKPAGILCTHAHRDHCANNAYFQEKYHIPVAMTAPEAGICSSILNLKCYHLVVSPDAAEHELHDMVHTPDLLIPMEDGPFALAGVSFQIVPTPGHSSGHICAVTPDRVCYTADAIMSREMLGAKLPYSLSIHHAMESRQRLRGVDCDLFIMAHKGICHKEEIGELIDLNHELILRRAREIRDLVTEPMPFSRLCQLVCQTYSLFTRRAQRALYYERNIRLFIEYLLDEGALAMESRQGVAYYLPGKPCKLEEKQI